MKAVVCTQFGSPDVLQVQEIEKPVPGDNEILIRTVATTVNYGDVIARDFAAVTPARFNMPFLLWLFARIAFGLRKPARQILGSEFSGEIEAVGKDVTTFRKGDQVFGYLSDKMGAYAEYICMPAAGSVAVKPARLSHEEAAAVPYGAIMALSLLQQAQLQPGQKALINGASGAIGSAALQLAKFHFGAEVHAVCSTPGIGYVTALGADRVFDYTHEDFTTSAETYDLILDVLGRVSFARASRVLRPQGRLMYASFKMKQVLEMLWTSRSGGKKVICAFASESAENLAFISTLVEAGTLRTIIDRSFPLAQTPAAHRHVEAGGKQGSVIITVAPQPEPAFAV